MIKIVLAALGSLTRGSPLLKFAFMVVLAILLCTVAAFHYRAKNPSAASIIGTGLLTFFVVIVIVARMFIQGLTLQKCR